MTQTLIDMWTQIHPVFWQLAITTVILYLVWLLMVVTVENFRLAGVRSRLEILDRYIAWTERAKLSGCVLDRYEVAEATLGWLERPKMGRIAKWFWIVFVAIFVWVSLWSMTLAVGQGLRHIAT